MKKVRGNRQKPFLCGAPPGNNRKVVGSIPGSEQASTRAMRGGQREHWCQGSPGSHMGAPFVIAIIAKHIGDPGRIRACNARLCGPMPYPLGHETCCTIQHCFISSTRINIVGNGNMSWWFDAHVFRTMTAITTS